MCIPDPDAYTFGNVKIPAHLRRSIQIQQRVGWSSERLCYDI
jgi:hypothetical protein